MNESEIFAETLNFLKMTASPFLYELTEPHLLYLSEEQSQDYLAAMGNENYSGSFHNALVKIIENNLPEIFSTKPDAFSLVDLGPGYPDKTIPIAKFLKARGTGLYYYPVDISRTYLDLARRHIERFTPNVFPILGRFEEGDTFPASINERETFVMIGLTFMNFKPEFIINILKSITRRGGHVLLASELITPIRPISRILENYAGPEVERFVFGPLRNLGFEPQNVLYRPRFEHGRVETCFKIKHLPISLSPQVKLGNGDEVITAVSYRYTIEEITALLQHYFEKHILFCSRDGTTVMAKCEDGL